jgi:hypothetical protein
LLYKFGSYSININGTVSSDTSKDYYLAVYFDHFDNSTDSWNGKVLTNQVNPISINNFTFSPQKVNGWYVAYNYNAPCIDCITPQEAALDEAARVFGYLQRFGDFFPYPGKSLSTNSVTSTISPLSTAIINGTRLITVEAGTFNCTELEGEGSTAWINHELPFPVKGSSFNGESYSSATKQGFMYYTSYRLVAMGNNFPTVPEFPFMPASIGVLAVAFGVIIGLRRMHQP